MTMVSELWSSSLTAPIVGSSSFKSALLRSLITAAAFGYRRSGLFSVHFKMILARLGDTSGFNILGSGIGSSRCASATVTVLSPSNGTWPVTISNMVIPKEYRSLRSSLYPPLACSGEI